MPRKRIRHYLKCPRQLRYPERILCFSAHHTREETSNGHARAKLSHWQIRPLKLAATGEYLPDGQDIDGQSGKLFWDSLFGAAQGRRQAWAYTFNLAWQFTLMDLYGLLEMGKLVIAETDPHAEDLPSRARRKPWHGCFIVEDPPTIVSLRRPGSRKTIKLVDIKNYGIDQMPGVAQGGVELGEVSRWVGEYNQLIRAGRLGSWQATAASQAFHGFRHAYLRCPVLVHDNTAALGLEREALFGGRCEAFRLGRVPGPLYYCDFNSHYSACALGQHVPVRLCSVRVLRSAQIIELLKLGYVALSEVVIETSQELYPYRRDGRVYFPTGRFSTVLAGPELQLALARGHVAQLGRTAYYESEDIFKDWLISMFDLLMRFKNSQNRYSATLLKTLAVSLFGKFAGWDWTWRHAPEVEAPGPWKIWWQKKPVSMRRRTTGSHGPGLSAASNGCAREPLVRWRSLNWRVEYEDSRTEAHESVPAIAAHLYSAGRCKLLAAMLLAGWDNVAYVCNDGMLVNKAGLSALRRADLMDDSHPGKLKLVDQYPWVKIYGNNHWETPTRTVHSGIPEYAHSEDGRSFTFELAEKCNGALVNGHPPHGIILHRQATIDGRYRYRKVHKNGRTTPLIFMEP